MRRILALAAGCVLSTGVLMAAPCAQAPTTLCLNASRFEVEVSWRDSRGRTGVGQAVSITADTGYFWFFSEANIELVVKVLDASSINQKYWVFFGALTSVEFDLNITDTATGAVKTYHNNLGNFASVGDTGAFEPIAPAPRHETVAVEGSPTPPASLEAIQGFIDASISKSADAFTPCPDTGAFLYLAGCRFRLEVHWTDSRGRHGAGRPVQLTNDTGYFWFFSDANVELMVKVLDARGVNNNFWVFFGALSNVEYTINVVDTASGALRSYRNPQSTFASVGDTSAFRGGYPITVQTDTAQAVSAEIIAEAGGSVSTTAADGTVFTLEIPPNSLLVDETVTMTPVRSAGNFPFAGGLVAGVDLQPSGIALYDGATLSIHTPASIPRSEETPVAWNGSGADFFLYPPRPTAGDLQMIILHLGGYGLARGTDAERQAQLAREPVAADDLLAHQISPLLRQGRAAASGSVTTLPANGFARRSTTDWLGEERTILERVQRDIATEMLSTDEPAVARRLLGESRAVAIRLRELGVEHAESGFPYDQMISQVFRKIHERCAQDPLAILEAAPFLRLFAGIFQEGVPLTRTSAEIGPMLGCLVFKLRFESTIAVANIGRQTLSYTVVAPEVTLRGRLDNLSSFLTDGVGPIDHTKADWTGPRPETCPNPPTWVSQPSTFYGKLYWDFSWGQTPKGVDLQYDPGTPHCVLSLVCPPSTITDTDAWFTAYEGLRSLFSEVGCRGTCFVRDGWTLTGRKDPWAIKIVPASFGPFAEFTVFTLTHTPE